MSQAQQSTKTSREQLIRAHLFAAARTAIDSEIDIKTLHALLSQAAASYMNSKANAAPIQATNPLKTRRVPRIDRLDLREYYSLTDIQTLLGISLSITHRLLAGAELKAISYQNGTWYRRSEVDTWLDSLGTTPEDRHLYTPRELAKILGICNNYASRLGRERRITSIELVGNKFGVRRRFPITAIQDYQAHLAKGKRAPLKEYKK